MSAGLAILMLAIVSPVLSMVVLAILQGLTEFLPVSSSGHLALGQILMGIGEGSLVEDIVLHLGTLVAVVIFYRRDILDLARGALARGAWLSPSRRYIALLVIANLPVAAVGILFEDQVKSSFDDSRSILIALSLTGLMLFLTRFVSRGQREVDLRRAVLIGLAQAIAIFPGCSRSGWTIGVALALGIAPASAARFSFLLSVPAILGAAVLEIPDIESGRASVLALSIGGVVAAAVGYLCLNWLVRLVRNMELHRFAYYLWILVAVATLAGI